MVGGRSLEFSLDIWERFIGCLPSQSNIVLYPSYTDPLPPPFEDITLNFLHEQFFNRPRPLNLNRFDSQQLEVMDNVLYKVVVHCIFPIVTRGMAKIRPPHAFLMHALKDRLDVNIALNTFMCIIHHIQPVRNKIHMPFGNVLTAWIASQGITISASEVTPLIHSDRLTKRNLSMAGLKLLGGRLQWDRRARAAAAEGQEDADDAEAAEAPAAEPAEEHTFGRQLADLQTFVADGFARLQMGQDSLVSRMESLGLQQSEILHLLRAQGASSSTSRGVQVPEDYDYMDLGDED